MLKVLDAMGVSSQEKAKLAACYSKMWLKFGMTNERMSGWLENAELQGGLLSRFSLIGPFPWN